MRFNIVDTWFVFCTPFVLGSIMPSPSKLLGGNAGPADAPKQLNCVKQVDVGAFDNFYEGISVGRMDIPLIQDGSGARFVTVDGGIVYHIYPANEESRQLVGSIRAEFDRAYECLVGVGASPEFKQWFVDFTRSFVDSNDANNMDAYISVAHFLQGILPFEEKFLEVNLNNPALSTENIEKSISEKDTGHFYTKGYDQQTEHMILQDSIHIPRPFRRLLKHISRRLDETADCDKIWELINLRGFLIATLLEINVLDSLGHQSQKLLADLYKHVESRGVRIKRDDESVDNILEHIDEISERTFLIHMILNSIFEKLFDGFFSMKGSTCPMRYYIFNHPTNPVDANMCGENVVESSTYYKDHRTSSGFSRSIFRKIVSTCMSSNDVDSAHAYARNIRESLRCRIHVTKVNWEKINNELAEFLPSGEMAKTVTPEDMARLGEASEFLVMTIGEGPRTIYKAFKLINWSPLEVSGLGVPTIGDLNALALLV